MRMRHAPASAALGTALTLGALTVPAAAAIGAVSTQASESSSWSPASVPASWRPFERYYWYLECLAACVADTSNSNHYRLWLYY